VNAMATGREFRNYAQACTRLAKTANTEANKATLLRMAEKWTGLAVQADRLKQLVREVDTAFVAADPEAAKAQASVRSSKAEIGLGSRLRARVKPAEPTVPPSPVKSAPVAAERKVSAA
jgi:hypothetical protein